MSVGGRQSAADCATIRGFRQRFGIEPATGQADPATADVARRLLLHIAASVGWLGAVTVSLVLAVLALTARVPYTANAVYPVLRPSDWYVLVPFGIVSLATGLTQSLFTV